MKNKHLILKTLALVSIIPIVDCGFSACSNSNSRVNINKKTYYSLSQEQALVISINDPKAKRVSFFLQNANSPYFYLANSMVDIVDGKAVAIICVDSAAWSEPLNATFDLNLSLLNENDNIIGQTTITGFSIFFRGQDLLHKDRVYCPKEDQILTLYGTHTATFRFILYKQIQSDVTLEINDTRGVLTLEKSVVSAKKDPNPSYLRWFVDVDVSLPLKAPKKELYNFNLQLKFVNSSGILQIQNFENLSIQYNQKDKTIPVEFYDIENGILKGFKPGTSAQLINYDTIEIPENVYLISSSAFGTTEERHNIRPYIKKIIFPKSVQLIEQNGLSGLINLFEIDISKYPEGSLPTWFKSEIPLFNADLSKQPFGYIWTSENDYDSDDIKHWITKLGLNSQWSAMRFDKVTPEYIFNIVDFEDTSTHEKYSRLTGVIDKYVDSLWMYAIIRIPDNVTFIDPGCFIHSFGIKPFLKHDSSKEATTRRLILNNNLLYVDTMAFSNSGIGGPILINRMYNDKAKKEERKNIFSNGCFSNIGFFNNVKGIDYTTEPISMYLNSKFGNVLHGFVSTTHSISETKDLFKTLSLPTSGEIIGDNAFNHSNIPGPIKLPNGLKEIGNNAFYRCSLLNADDPEKTTLTIPNSVEKIGDYAFSKNEVRTLVIERDQKEFKTLDIGNHAFGDVTGGKKTLTKLDISSYKTTDPSKLPTWLSSGNEIFENGINPNKGIICVSPEVYNTYGKENDVLSVLKEYLIENGFPRDNIKMPGETGETLYWHFEIKN